MLLKSFKDTLVLVQDMVKYRLGIINPAVLANTLRLSFIVELRADLCHGKSVPLFHVGTLIPSATDVVFSPENSLREDAQHHTVRLGEFLKENFGSMRSHFLGAFNWHTLFVNNGAEVMMPGQEFLESLAVDMLLMQRKHDRNLKKLSFAVLEDACGLLLHDAICCGAGAELETIGEFKPDCSFTPDEEILLKSLRATQHNTATSDVTLPEFSRIGSFSREDIKV